MSFLAGFDVVIELSRETLERMIRAKQSISGTPALIPFEVTVPFSVEGQSGSVHFMVTDVNNGIQLASLTPDEKANVNILFTDSSVIAGNFVAAPLSGMATISVPLRITSQVENPRTSLVADFTDREFAAEIILDFASMQTVQQALAQVVGVDVYRMALVVAEHVNLD